MKNPSPALTMLILFWAVYGLVAAIVLYEALPPVHLELLLLLGSIAGVLAAASLVLLWRAPLPGPAEEPGR
jgi:hypothetical protein